MRPIGVGDWPGMTPWNVSCAGTRSDRLRPISMKVFLMIRFIEAPLSINVLVILYCPIGYLTTNGKFLSDSSVSGWSSGLNVISMLDHFIHLLGSMCYAKLISAMLRSASLAPCCANAMSGEPSGAMRWIDLIIVWSRTALKSGFRF
jgi:hypothetical protein